jgi:hypothetical protein
MEQEIVIQLTGKWKKGINKINYTLQDIEDIKKDLTEGILLSEILVKHKVSREIIQKIFDDHIHAKHRTTVPEKEVKSNFILGKKTLWDFKSEKEMLEEKPYTWDTLSQEEIDFYHKYKIENLL